MSTSGNTMVGAAIAQALVTTTNAGSTSGGRARIPGCQSSGESDQRDGVELRIGERGRHSGADAERVEQRQHGFVDGERYSNLNYSMNVTSGFAAPSGPLIDGPAVGGNAHTVTMDTSTPGLKSATLTINSDDPDQLTRVVTLIGEVLDATCAKLISTAMERSTSLTISTSLMPTARVIVAEISMVILRSTSLITLILWMHSVRGVEKAQ